MLLAIPCRDTSLFNHFAKARQVMLWNSQTNTKRTLELPESSCCGHKRFWRKLLEDNKVDAVVVSSIGSNMLSTLCKLNVSVLSAPCGFCLESFDVSRLTPVIDIGFARQSSKKNRPSCAKESARHSPTIGLRHANHHKGNTDQRTLNKLSPQAFKHLAHVFKSAEQAEKKQ